MLISGRQEHFATEANLVSRGRVSCEQQIFVHRPSRMPYVFTSYVVLDKTAWPPPAGRVFTSGSGPGSRLARICVVLWPNQRASQDGRAGRPGQAGQVRWSRNNKQDHRRGHSLFARYNIYPSIYGRGEKTNYENKYVETTENGHTSHAFWANRQRRGKLVPRSRGAQNLAGKEVGACACVHACV